MAVYQQYPRLGRSIVFSMVRLRADVETTLENVEDNLGSVITIVGPRPVEAE